MMKNKEPDVFIKQFKGIFQKIITIPIENEKNCMSAKDLKSIGLNVRGKHGNYILVTFKTEEVAKNIVKFLKEKLIYVKGPYLKPWNMCICFTVGPQEYMKKFISAIKEAKEKNIF